MPKQAGKKARTLPRSKSGETDPAQPEATAGYDLTRFNATRHGILSKRTVLSWEDPGEYQTLLEALMEEHQPEGPTEEHLVEELAGIIWRKGRLREAEAAMIHRELKRNLSDPNRFLNEDDVNSSSAAAMILVSEDTAFEARLVRQVLRMGSAEVAQELNTIDKRLPKIEKAIELLEADFEAGYETALAKLDPATRSDWDSGCEDGEDTYEDDDGPLSPEQSAKATYELWKWLRNDVRADLRKRKALLTHRASVRQQVFGDAIDPRDLEKLTRYEVHLDRKLERTLSMLLKLQSLRRDRPSP